jgi:DNA-binding PadR family transcriptional regulator
MKSITFEKRLARLPPDLLPVFRALSDPFRWILLDKFPSPGDLSFSQVQTSTNRPGGFIAPHLHQLEFAGLVQNFIQKRPDSLNYSFYELTAFGSCWVKELRQWERQFFSRQDNDLEFLSTLCEGLKSAFCCTLAFWLYDQSPRTFSDLIRDTHLPKSRLTAELHRLITAQIIENYFEKRAGTRNYSYYRVTAIGRSFLETIRQIYTNFYAPKKKDRKNKQRVLSNLTHLPAGTCSLSEDAREYDFNDI